LKYSRGTCCVAELTPKLQIYFYSADKTNKTYADLSFFDGNGYFCSNNEVWLQLFKKDLVTSSNQKRLRGATESKEI
jgi:hypothetical protein